jgi:hypothetical protein
MRLRRLLPVVALAWAAAPARSAELLLEAESFANRGGWVVDQQFADLSRRSP